jgi:hypothetical protein
MGDTFAYKFNFLHDHHKYKRVQKKRLADDDSIFGNAFAMFPLQAGDFILSYSNFNTFPDIINWG